MSAEYIPASKWREWDEIAAVGRAFIARRGRDIKFVCANMPDAADTPKDSRRGRRQKVICLDTGEIFESVTAAGLAAKPGARATSVASQVSAVCRGEMRTYLGMRYMFYDEYVKEERK